MKNDVNSNLHFFNKILSNSLKMFSKFKSTNQKQNVSGNWVAWKLGKRFNKKRQSLKLKKIEPISERNYLICIFWLVNIICFEKLGTKAKSRPEKYCLKILREGGAAGNLFGTDISEKLKEMETVHAERAKYILMRYLQPVQSTNVLGTFLLIVFVNKY